MCIGRGKVWHVGPVVLGMDVANAVEFARSTRQSVLVTVRPNGLPQLSNVMHAIDAEGTIRVSITAERAKYKNLLRRPWAALHVTRPDFYAYAVLEADVDLSSVAADIDDDAVVELVELYRSLVGEHEDWDAYRTAMVSEQRLVLRLRPTRAYGMLPTSGSDG